MIVGGQHVVNTHLEHLCNRFRRAGVDLSAHTLRHTFAKNLVDAGVTLEKVAALLGHSSLDTTRVYTTPGKSDLEKAVSVLDG